jgi:hypothetical protein
VPAATAPRCAACFNSWFRATRPPDDDGEIDRLLAENGCDPDTPVTLRPWPGGAIDPKYAGLTAELATVPADAVPSWRALWGFQPPDGPAQTILRARIWTAGSTAPLVWGLNLSTGGDIIRGGSAREHDRLLASLKAIRRKNPGGRATNVAKPHPEKVAIAKRVAAIRRDEPKLGWDQIGARLGTSYVGKTLQKWIETDRLHER